jgi:DNA-nicking Smr family endonuclease
MAGRRLSPDEAALWRRVAGSVRAIRPAMMLDLEAQPARSPKVQSGDPARSIHPAMTQGMKVVANRQPQNTLDGTWDKKIDTGRLTPDRTIDLHGYNLAAAHHRLDRGLDEAIRNSARVILLITGRAARAGTSRIDLPLRGIIRESVGDWLAASRHAGAIAAVRNAHPRHGGAGALYIVLRRTL